MEECEALGVRAIGLEADLTDRAATEKAVAEVAEKLGRIDIAVCNGLASFCTRRISWTSSPPAFLPTRPRKCSPA